MEPKMVILGTKMVLPGTKKGSSKGYPMRKAKQRFSVQDSIFFSTSLGTVLTKGSLDKA
jgi:hypothetical protein